METNTTEIKLEDIPAEVINKMIEDSNNEGPGKHDFVHLKTRTGYVQRPNLQQVAWVLAHLNDHLANPGSYRYLIYTRLGFGYEAYVPLLDAGGMNISNAFHDANLTTRDRLDTRTPATTPTPNPTEVQ